jgi:hypothetical protein
VRLGGTVSLRSERGGRSFDRIVDGRVAKWPTFCPRGGIRRFRARMKMMFPLAQTGESGYNHWSARAGLSAPAGWDANLTLGGKKGYGNRSE